MRIAHNIMAMNTHRSYTINNDKVAGSAEKLSSGYRINRAADDAAGLAISEKMRSQIRGINMAARNGQDASSLIQTAEGALQEVHAMLQRMNELAVQSATGTNETFDRTQIHKEFEQLKREINDISEQTTFNNMKLLDGSLSNDGIQRSAQTTGILPEVAEKAGKIDMTSVITGAGTPGSAGSPAVQGSASFSMAITAGTTSGAQSFTIDGQTVTATLTGSEVDDDAVAALFDTAIKALGGDYTNYSVTHDGTNYVVESGANPAADAAMVVGGGGTAVGAPTAAEAEVLPSAADPKVNTLTFTDNFKIGDTVSIEGKVYEFTAAGGTAATGNTAVTIGADVDASLTALAAGATTGGTGDVTVAAATGGTLTLTQAIPGTGEVQATVQAATSKSTTVEFDPVKMHTGDVVSLEVTGADGTVNTVSYTHNEGGTMENIANSLAGGAAGGVRKGNTIYFADSTVKINFTSADQNQGERMRIQVGALEGEQLNIEVKAMNTAGLSLDGTDISTQDLAGNAITATRSAINTVSDQRALLGAMQNRMTYKINNIKVSAENLQAAESRIRDIDIASEMTEFTKNNILSQAATAMLAQANAAPQNVLSLLR